ncbi:MAG: Bax inhibitor-1/YccA family protein [Chitinophagales bacterium]|nr:Bax inhibitor-1/YccA family protein [Chitinophagales bacterium]
MSRRKGFFESRNPVMKDKLYQQSSNEVIDGEMVRGGIISERMTVQGAINKSFVLGGIMLATALFAFTAAPALQPLLMWGGAIGGLIVVLIASFRPKSSPITAPIYAALEGLFVGGISAVYASAFNGIVFQAVTLTMAVFFLMLFIYKARIIKVTSKFRTGVIMATGAVFVVYLLSWVLSMFGINMPYLHEGGMIGIGISLVIVGIASLNLLLDFDNFEKGEQYGAPKYMEWFSAMGLLVTLVWLYIEILRLIAIFSSND